MDANSQKQVFDELFKVNVNGHTEEKKGGDGKTLTYLSWCYAWAEVKKRYPEAQYEIEKFNGLPYVFDPLTGYMVYTKVTIEGITHEMWLPVMDSNNRAMKAEPYQVQTKYKTFTVSSATMFEVNKAIMRCLVKNLAMFGLGMYIYAGEDIPEEEQNAVNTELETALYAVDNAKTSEEVTKLWRNDFAHLQKNEIFKAEVQKVGTALKAQEAQQNVQQ